MPDIARLLSAAFKSELRASRRLASRTGCSLEAALRATLAASIGGDADADAGADAGKIDSSLAGLLVARDALRVADEARAAAIARHRPGQPAAWRGWFDGSAHPNPGACGIGALLKGPAGEYVEISRAAGYGNSSEAEYRALIALLEAALDCGAHGLTIYGDSKVVIDDINGLFAGAVVSLLDCRAQALALMAQLPDVSVRWIARHKNSEADALSQRAGRESPGNG
jgi:ribonuclease HI